jgi:hypothetical protein
MADFKVGDRVSYTASPQFTFTGTIIAIDNSKFATSNCIVDWDNCTTGLYSPSSLSKIEDNTLPQTAGEHGNISATTSHRKEAPCPGCSRMNDIGVHSCWCCGGKL